MQNGVRAVRSLAQSRVGAVEPRKLASREGVDQRRFVPPRPFVACLLLIVSRTDPAQYAYLKHVFGSKTVDVILDRRVGEERQSQERAAAERRRMDRRERDITEDLQIFGWALVRR